MNGYKIINGYKILVAYAHFINRLIPDSLLWFLMAFFLVGCGTKRTVTDGKTNTVATVERVMTLQNSHFNGPSMTAKLKFRVNIDGKETGLGGTLRMKRNEVIQMQLVDPLLGIMEVARLEFTPTEVLMVDRVNKRFARVKYSEAPMLAQNGVGFNMLQDLFWNRLFLPGDGTRVLDATQFDVVPQTDGTICLNYKNTGGEMETCAFTIAGDGEQLVKTVISDASKRTDMALTFTYSNFDKVEETVFPTKMEMNVNAKGKKLSAQFDLSNVKVTDNWEKRTSVNENKYKKIDLDTLLKMINKL